MNLWESLKIAVATLAAAIEEEVRIGDSAIAQLPVGAQVKEGHGGDKAGSQRGGSSTVDRVRSRRQLGQAIARMTASQEYTRAKIG